METRKRGNNKGSKNHPGRRKGRIPIETFDNAILEDVTRVYPSVDFLSKTEQGELDKRAYALKEFERSARIPYQVANLVSARLSGKPSFEQKSIFEEPGKSKKRKYSFRDPWDGDSMVIVKEGKLPITAGFNLIITHSDSPCLRLKPKPVKLEWDEDKKYQHWGIRFSATAHGGLKVPQWSGQEMDVLGYFIDINGDKQFIELPTVIAGRSAHIDYTGEEEVNEAFKPEQTFEVIPGHVSLKETLSKLGLESMDDFAQAKLFAVPTHPPRLIDEYTWRLLPGYGHDNKACTYSAVDAIIRVRNPTLTSIVWISDNEEVGNIPPSGTKGPFLDLVLDYLCQKYEEANEGEEISERDKRRLLLDSSLIYADVDIAPFGPDVEDEDIDVLNAPKLGLGMSIATNAEAVSHLDFVRKLRGFAKRGASRGYNICHQVVGNVYNQDREEVWAYKTYEKGILKYIGQWANGVGIPCGCLHNPTEVICPGDEFALSRFLRRFLQSNTGIGESNR